MSVNKVFNLPNEVNLEQNRRKIVAKLEGK